MGKIYTRRTFLLIASHLNEGYSAAFIVFTRFFNYYNEKIKMTFIEHFRFASSESN